ncbi:copper chaperone PCu(A)C [Saccharothrix longispora]|uniref:Copper(I)-binding protein n=1 Tax=Saccharothrix longispora TaxID=33920 RepID=A0ABU1PUH2_9PSEU|nr:copper chaperone PCu(A)C [Saccharothrix longispora]MDR6594292.1 copper(I)-binding protein [Saccharothrix longispora]
MDGIRTLALLGATSLVLAGCGEPQQVLRSGTMGANGHVGEVVLRNVLVEAPAGGPWRAGDDADVTLTLLTDADRPDALVAVSTDSAAGVELLADRDCDGRSERVDRIRLPAEGAVVEPGSVDTAYHLRIVDFTREVLAGTTIPLTFTFADAGRTTLDVPVEVVGDGDVPPPVTCTATPSPTPGTTPATTPATTPGTSPSRPDTVLRGRVQAGVEPGCLVLATDRGLFLLLGGDEDVLRAGAEVVVDGTARPDQATTCQQGTPFAVTEARIAPTTR